jgi:hypothetical protein
MKSRIQKPIMNDIPVSFRIEKDAYDLIEETMIERKEFNKSRIHREIFDLGLEQFKKQNKK